MLNVEPQYQRNRQNINDTTDIIVNTSVLEKHSKK